MAGLTVKIKGDASQFDKTMSSVKGTLASISSPLAAVGKAGLAIGAAFTAAAGAVGYAAYKLNSIGEEGRASDAKLKNVVSTMGLFGNQADVVATRLLDVADATARKIGVDDDLIASTQAIVMSFEDIGKSADVAGGLFDQVTKAALDMSVLFGGDATSYAVQLGKALSDPEKGLTALKKTGALTRADIERIGGEFKKTGDKGQAFADIIGAINRQVSGQSEAVARSSEKIKVSISQLVETFAKPFSKGFADLVPALESIFPAISEKANELGQMVGATIALAIQGDSSKLAQTGIAIGSIIADGILIGLGLAKEKIALYLSDYYPGTAILKGVLGTVTGRTREQVNQSFSEDLNKRASTEMANAITSFNNQIETIRAGTLTMTGAGGGQFRPAMPGETSIYSDALGNKLVPLLQNIITNTQPQGFPSK